jgi:hypothetical protein
MRRFILAAAFAVSPLVAFAQNAPVVPSIVHNTGVLSLTTASVAVTTMTLAATSPILTFPTPLNTISFQNISTSAGSAWLWHRRDHHHDMRHASSD